jgi:hypothetical protein
MPPNDAHRRHIAELNERSRKIAAERKADRLRRKSERKQEIKMAKTLNAENIAAETAPPPPPNTAAWDALMIELCHERQAIDDEAGGFKAIIGKKRKTLKARVTDAQSAMGPFDNIYKKWQVRERAEETGDDTVLIALAEADRVAWRVLRLGTQPEFAGLDPAKKAAASSAHEERMKSARSCGFEAGCRSGAKLADAYAIWTAAGTRSKSETRAFEDGFAEGVQRFGEQSAPSDHAPKQWQREKGRRGRLSAAELAEKAAFEAASAVSARSAAACISRSRAAAAYQSGWGLHAAGVSLDEAVEGGEAENLANAELQQLRTGWSDRDFEHPRAGPAETEIDRATRLEAERVAALPVVSEEDGGEHFDRETDERIMQDAAGSA